MRPDYLDDALGRTGARLVVLQPLYQNPTGVSLTEGRARELLAVARSHDAFVLEDDYARHMTHDDGIPPVKPLILLESDGAVIHIRSLARLQTALTQRRRLAVRTVVETLGADVLPDHPRGGYHLWLHLPRGTGESEFVSAALARGTALAPGTYFHADQPDAPRSPELRSSAHDSGPGHGHPSTRRTRVRRTATAPRSGQWVRGMRRSARSTRTRTTATASTMRPPTSELHCMPEEKAAVAASTIEACNGD